ncbi:hypothetical protein PR003_g13902 [Phytophthora rubi]|uniref:Integrase catalytic domain-containing protein n=1 Tax=Phytophthora rubi TaxID=129364 RepID=A0A6A4EWC1_9STRA|nr:hypothetical protein PR003_g13902 [Phytophthora rubi]
MDSLRYGLTTGAMGDGLSVCELANKRFPKSLYPWIEELFDQKVGCRLFSTLDLASACKWFLSHPNVSGKLARWLAFFGQFSFVLHHVKDSTNDVADALSRVAKPAVEDTPVKTASIAVLPPLQTSEIKLHGCTEACVDIASGIRQPGNEILALGELSLRDLDLLCGGSHFSGEGGSVARPIEVPQAVTRLKASQLTIVTVQVDAATKLLILRGYRRDPLYRGLIKHSAPKTQNIANLGTLQKENGMLYRAEAGNRVLRLCVPAEQTPRTTHVAEAHDGPVAAHAGIRRTQQKLSLWYFWPPMETDVMVYVQSCPACARFKSSNLRNKGRHMPLRVPSECWGVVGMDFVTGRPVSKGYDAIMVVVDLLGKRAQYVPTHTTATAAETARHFFDLLIRNHGLPLAIVSDRDPKLTSSLWMELMKVLEVKIRMATSYRAQADGQVDRQNRVLEDALHCMVSLEGTNWVDVLGTVEHVHATLVSASTKLSPFEIDIGRVARPPVGATISRNDYVQNFTEERKRIVAQAQQNLFDAQKRQREQYNRKRS